jgi:hypothetical protein
VRLAPSFALLHGYRLYYGLSDGPLLQTAYGPIGALFYLPATLAATPTSALLIAEALTQAIAFGPLLWVLVLTHRRNPPMAMVGLLAFTGLCLLAFRSAPLAYSCFSVHVDAPALGMAALACTVMCQRRKAESLLPLAASATLAVLSVWTKFSMAPLLAVLPAYVWLSEGRTAFFRFWVCLAMCGLIVSLALLLLFGPRELYFNAVTLLARLPWKPGDKVVLLSGIGRELLGYICLPVLAMAAYAWFNFRSAALASGFRARSWWKQNPWTLPGMFGLAMVPVCIRHKANVGGDVNALSPAVYFLFVAATMLLVQVSATPSTGRFLSLEKASKLGALTIAVCTLFLSHPSPDQLTLATKALPQNPQQEFYNFLKANPDRAFFPDHPLPALMAQGRLYHFSYGLFGRELVGMPVSSEQFRKYLPPSMEVVVLSPDQTIIDAGYSHPVPRQLPEFSQRRVMSNGYVIYKRP